jgi:hypothetical protein
LGKALTFVFANARVDTLEKQLQTGRGDALVVAFCFIALREETRERGEFRRRGLRQRWVVIGQRHS